MISLSLSLCINPIESVLPLSLSTARTTECDLTRSLFIDSACFQLASQSRSSSTLLFFVSAMPQKTEQKSRPPVMQSFHVYIGYWLTGGFPFYLFVFYIQALKVLRTAEYAPLVVFIAAPSMSALAELRSSINVSHPSYHNRKKTKKNTREKFRRKNQD